LVPQWLRHHSSGAVFRSFPFLSDPEGFLEGIAKWPQSFLSLTRIGKDAFFLYTFTAFILHTLIYDDLNKSFIPMHLNGPLWTPSVYFKALFGEVPIWEPQKDGDEATF